MGDAATPSTPTKTLQRTEGKCRLCLAETQTKRLLNIMNPVNVKKELTAKINIICGIDMTTGTICYKCERRLMKCWEFRTNCQFNQSQIPVITKRCIASPSQKQTHKKINIDSQAINVNENVNENVNKQLKFENEQISEAQYNNLIRAIETKCPKAIAHILKKNCNSIFIELMKLIYEEVGDACSELCKLSKSPSVLSNMSYEGMSKFSLNDIWMEMKNIPILVDILMAVSCTENRLNQEITPKLANKMSFVYAVLMQERFRKLSLLQRVTTVLLIEGGGSSKVCLMNLYHHQ